MSPLEVLRRGGEVSDAQFDAMYPDWVQDLSDMFWTPVCVAKRAAEFLLTDPADRVLDVGSGVGKFCFVATCAGVGRVDGIEQRLELVQLSQDIAAGAHLESEFLHGDGLELSWQDYTGIYLYNPFFELTSGPWCQIDDSLPHSVERQKHYVQGVETKLRDTRSGTLVATYFGFGGKMPEDYRKIAYEQYEKGPLEVWRKE